MEGKTTSWLLEREQFLFEIKRVFSVFLISDVDSNGPSAPT
jgi:hypothetical protein